VPLSNKQQTNIDECKLLDSSPIYVTEKPDNMPSLLFEGDLSFLSARFDKLDAILACHGCLLAAIFNNRQQPQQPQWPTTSATKV